MAAANPPASLPGFQKAIDPAVQEYFNDEYSKEDPMTEKVYMVGDQEVYNHEEQTNFGLGELQVVGEAEIYPEDSPIQGYTTTYTPLKRGVIVPITDELRRFDLSALAKVEERTREAARAVSHSVSKVGASTYNDGFSTAATSYGDAKPLFSVDHTRADGATSQANASATGITLTEGNLETAIIQFRQQLTDRGMPIASFPVKLIVPLALTKEALIITKSDKRSGTADNDANVYKMGEYKGGRLDVIEWRYLDSQLGGSDTAWFLLGNEHKVKWFWTVSPELAKEDIAGGFANDTFRYKTRYEGSRGWSDWRGTWGSKGDGAAYSS